MDGWDGWMDGTSRLADHDVSIHVPSTFRRTTVDGPSVKVDDHLQWMVHYLLNVQKRSFLSALRFQLPQLPHPQPSVQLDRRRSTKPFERAMGKPGESRVAGVGWTGPVDVAGPSRSSEHTSTFICGVMVSPQPTAIRDLQPGHPERRSWYWVSDLTGVEVIVMEEFNLRWAVAGSSRIGATARSL